MNTPEEIAERLSRAAVSLGFFAQAQAKRCFPEGFRLTNDKSYTPSNLPELNSVMRYRNFWKGVNGPTFKVWSGASDRTIFLSPHLNHCFRAWHDWTHWRIQAPFTLTGEIRVAVAQAKALPLGYVTMTGYRRTCDLLAVLFCEVIGQAWALERGEGFPEDQIAFTRDHWQEWLPAADLVLEHV